MSKKLIVSLIEEHNINTFVKFNLTNFDEYIYESQYLQKYSLQEIQEEKEKLEKSILSEYFIFKIIKKFINVKINPNKYSIIVNKYIQYIKQQNNKNYKILIDCIGINIGKRLHFGHLRNLLISTIIYNELDRFNYSVYIDTHIGDYGLNLIVFIFYYENNKNIKDLNITELTNIYKQTRNYIEQSNIDVSNLFFNKQLEEVKDILTNKSINYLNEILQFMKLKVDYLFGESRYVELCQYLKKYFLDNKLCTIDENNRLITNNNLVLTRSNNTPIYAYIDIATIYERSLFYKYNYILYIVDNRQSKHFEQVFEFTSQIDTLLKNLKFIGYGHVLNQNKEIFATRSSDQQNHSDDILEYLKYLDYKYSDRKAILLSLLLYESRHVTKNDYIFSEIYIHQYIKIIKKVYSNINNKCKTSNEGLDKLYIQIYRTFEYIIMFTQRVVIDKDIDTHIFYTGIYKLIQELSKYDTYTQDIIECINFILGKYYI